MNEGMMGIKDEGYLDITSDIRPPCFNHGSGLGITNGFTGV